MPSRVNPRALQRISCLLPILQTTGVMQHMGIAVALQELAEGCTCYTILVGTVYDNLVIFVKRLDRLFHGGEVYGSRNMLGLEGPLCQSHHQAKIFLAVQLLFQFFATDRFHISLLSNAARSQCARVAPAS